MEAVPGRSVRKPIRSASGVLVVAVMTPPHPCPHGRCVYCPGGPGDGTPQSYVAESPAVLRAARHGYHPYRQVWARLRQYVSMGHVPSKVECIVMGGTFPSMPRSYQEWFVAMVYEALNRFPDPGPPPRTSLEGAQAANETALFRCVGLTVETRPDWSFEPHVDLFLRLGATRVELGVQTVYDEVLGLSGRGHGVGEVVRATRVLKDAGYKVVYHIMPGLPGSSPEMDLEAYRTIMTDPRFMPDMVKIYPTLVVPGTLLHRWWVEGRYRGYGEETWLRLLAAMKAATPRWVRIIRVGRDIPAKYVAEGPVGNLRERVQAWMAGHGLSCSCTRCREVGIRLLKGLPTGGGLRLRRTEYVASGGREVFLEYVDEHDALYALLRLRLPSLGAHRREVRGAALVRELHVYGPQVPVGWGPGVAQHRGLGRRLLAEAERIASDEWGVDRVLVLSGVGVREYYRRLGYTRVPGTPYMGKAVG